MLSKEKITESVSTNCKETINVGCQTSDTWETVEDINNRCMMLEDDLERKDFETQRILNEKQQLKSENVQLKQTCAETASVGCQIGATWKTFDQINTNCKKLECDLERREVEAQNILNEKQKLRTENAKLKQSVITLEDHQGILRKAIETKDEHLRNHKDNNAVTELTDKLKTVIAENEIHKSNILTFTNKNHDLITEIEKKTEVSRRDNAELAQLRLGDMEFEKSMQTYKDSEQKLREIINDKDNELVSQQEKFREAGNPTYDAMVNFEEAIEKKLDQVGKSLEKLF